MTNEEIFAQIAYQESPEGIAEAQAAWDADAPNRELRRQQRLSTQLRLKEEWLDSLADMSYDELLDEVDDIADEGDSRDRWAVTKELRNRKCQATESA